MKIAVVYGTPHRGSTSHIARLLLESVGQDLDITEFTLPKDMNNFCVGCFSCFYKGESFCPHAESVQIIAKALEESDLLVFTSPTYGMTMSGQLKALFDHLCYQWMAHRPNPAMFSKTAIIFTTTAGMGARSTAKAIEQNLFFWGIPRILTFAKRVVARNWQEVKEDTKQKIVKDAEKLAKKVKKLKAPKPSLKLKFIYSMMLLNQKGNDYNPTDRNHWEKHGWLSKTRPWSK